MQFSYPLFSSKCLQNTSFFCYISRSLHFLPEWMKFGSFCISLALNESAKNGDEKIFLLSGLTWNCPRCSTIWGLSLLFARFESPQTFALKIDLIWGQLPHMKSNRFKTPDDNWAYFTTDMSSSVSIANMDSAIIKY